MVETLSRSPRGAVAERAIWPHAGLLDVLSATPSTASSDEAESDEPARQEARRTAESSEALGSPLTAHLAVEAAQRPAQVQQNQALSADAARRAPARWEGQIAERTNRAQFRAALADAQQRSTMPHAPDSGSASAQTSAGTETALRGGGETPSAAPGDKAGPTIKAQAAVAGAPQTPAANIPAVTEAQGPPAQPQPGAGPELNGPRPGGPASGAPIASAEVAIRNIAATTAFAAAPAPIVSPHSVPSVEPTSMTAARGVGSAPTLTGAAPAQNGSVGEAGGVRGPSTTTPNAATGTPKPAGASSPGENDANIEQIVRWARSRLEGQRSTTVMRLDPPLLGTLRLRLDLDHGAAVLTIDADQPLAQRLLSEHLDTLHRGFEAAGIRLEHVEVRYAADPERSTLAGGYDADPERGQPPPQERPDEQPGEPRTQRDADGLPAPTEPPAGRVEGDEAAPRGASRVNLWV